MTPQLIIIIVAVIVGLFLLSKGDKKPGQTHQQAKEADMYRMYAYILFGIAGALVLYFYFLQDRYGAKMCGGGRQYAYMHGSQY